MLALRDLMRPVGEQNLMQPVCPICSRPLRLTGHHELSELAAEMNLMSDRLLEVEIARMFSYRVVTLQNRGLIPNYEASMMKLYNAELNQRIARTGLRTLGLYGQLDRGSEFAPNKGRQTYSFLRSVAYTIEGGTSEVQRNIVAQRGLGLPRD